MEKPQGKGKPGYSERIADPAFQQPQPGTAGSMKYLLFVVPVAALVLLWRSGVISMVLAVLLLAVLVVLTLPPIVKERRLAADSTYDGVIESITRQEPVSSASPAHVMQAAGERVVLTTLRIRDEAGGLHIHERMGSLREDYREYYHPGDRVRHHRGFDLPEKYDKSADTQVVCIACGRIQSIDARRCGECGVVLLK